jgi:anaerobic selenocysteine-containing dehydrogenase
MLRQLTGADRMGLRDSPRSRNHVEVKPRTEEADRVGSSICPYCAVGCAQRVFVKDEQVTQIERGPWSARWEPRRPIAVAAGSMILAPAHWPSVSPSCGRARHRRATPSVRTPSKRGPASWAGRRAHGKHASQHT